MPRVAVARILIGPALVCLLAVGSIGCVRPPAQRLRVGLLVWPPYELFFVAQARGLYDPERIRLVSYRSPAEVTRAYQTGLLDALAITSGYAFQLQVKDPTNVAILVIDVSNGGDAVIAKPEISGLAALRGRRIGAEASALGTFMLRTTLERAGLSLDDVTTVPIDLGDQEDAYRKGLVDAVVTYEPIRSRLLESGGRELFSSHWIPWQIVDLLIVRRSVLERRQMDLESLLAGWFAAEDLLRDHPRETAQTMAARERLAPDQILAALAGATIPSFEENERQLSGADPTLVRALAEHEEALVRFGILERTVPVDGMLSDAVLRGLGR